MPRGHRVKVQKSDFVPRMFGGWLGIGDTLGGVTRSVVEHVSAGVLVNVSDGVMSTAA